MRLWLARRVYPGPSTSCSWSLHSLKLPVSWLPTTYRSGEGSLSGMQSNVTTDYTSMMVVGGVV